MGKMDVISNNYDQVSPGIDTRRLTIMLPCGQDIRNMSFTKEQQSAAAARRRFQSSGHSPRAPYTLKTVSSTSIVPPQREDRRSWSSSSRPSAKPISREPSTDKVREVHWQNMEIPSELDLLHGGTPEEIHNIVQESLDEHRAMRASRQSQPQAIVVRTTITQSRSREEVGKLTALTQSSASATSRESISGDWSSARSLGLESTSSLNSSEGDSGLLKPPSLYDNSRFLVSQEDVLAEAGVKTMQRRIRDKPLKERGVFKLFAGWKGKEADRRGWDDDRSHSCQCTSCSDELPTNAAISLACRHKYCSPCFSQLILTSIRSESTFPPKCCLQEIPRNTMRSHLASEDVAQFDEKTLEYAFAVGNRYYCASPKCGKWIDVRTAHAYEGALRCPRCGSSVCTVCRGQGQSKDQGCPSDFGLSATLQQAKRAGWQRCYNCRAVVEPNKGRRHITCRCRAQFCYICDAPWKTCTCTEDDRRRREEEIQRRRQRYEAEARAEEAEVQAAIAAVEATERSVAHEREAEEERLAEEARQITAREYERLEAITEFFEYLRGTLEQVRLQQMQAMERRHRIEIEETQEKENALVSGEPILDRDQKASAERVKIVKENEDTMKNLRKKHADELMETVRRHRKDQDAYMLQSTEPPATGGHVNQAGIIEMLLEAQDAERAMLRSQQARTIQKYEKRGPRLLEEFDRRREAERATLIETQIKEAEEVTQLVAATEMQIAADWKWFDAIFLDRAMMLGEDERRMVLSGASAPKQLQHC